MPTTTSEPYSLVVTDEEKNAAVNRGIRDLRAWRKRNTDAPRGWGERDPRIDANDPPEVA